MSGNDGFHADNKENALPAVRFKQKPKFAAKVMIWIAISGNSYSNIFVKPSGLAINSKVYIEECVWVKLAPFIQEAHQGDQILFWSDLASSHYSRVTQAALS